MTEKDREALIYRELADVAALLGISPQRFVELTDEQIESITEDLGDYLVELDALENPGDDAF
jgi:hypothetical protein